MPPTPTTFEVTVLGTTVLDFSWAAVTGDFDNYLIVVHHDPESTDVADQVLLRVDKTLTKYRYVYTVPIIGLTFYTEKGTVRSSRITNGLPTVIKVSKFTLSFMIKYK